MVITSPPTWEWLEWSILMKIVYFTQVMNLLYFKSTDGQTKEWMGGGGEIVTEVDDA